MLNDHSPLDTARWITVRLNLEEDKLPLRGSKWIGSSQRCEHDARRFLATVVDFQLPEHRPIASAKLHSGLKEVPFSIPLLPFR